MTRQFSVAAPTYGITAPGISSAHANVSYVVGSHDLKFGYQPEFRWSRGLEPAYSMSHYPSGLRANFRNGVPDSVNTYNTPVC